MTALFLPRLILSWLRFNFFVLAPTDQEGIVFLYLLSHGYPSLPCWVRKPRFFVWVLLDGQKLTNFGGSIWGDFGGGFGVSKFRANPCSRAGLRAFCPPRKNNVLCIVFGVRLGLELTHQRGGGPDWSKINHRPNLEITLCQTQLKSSES